ncbi:MAG: F-type H+-transporting ATPase subunit delta [Alphaproteobacteria bacterium]
MASEHTGASGVAGRYASALFDLALERAEIDNVAVELEQLQAVIDDSADLRRFLRSPLFSREDQSRAMAAIVAAAGVSALVGNLIGVVTGNRRLFALEAIISAYRALVSAHRGEVAAEVTTAHPLSDAHRGAVELALKDAVGSAVLMETSVDPDLLGGMVVRVGSRMVDSSLRTKLQRLQLSMKGAA